MRAPTLVLLVALSAALQLGCTAKRSLAHENLRARGSHSLSSPSSSPDPFRKLRQALGSVRGTRSAPARTPTSAAARAALIPPVADLPAPTALERPVGTAGEWSVAVTTARTLSAPSATGFTGALDRLGGGGGTGIAASALAVGLLAAAILGYRLTRRHRTPSADRQ